MITFLSSFALGYVAATLLVSGAGHVVRPARFRALLVGHAVLPARLALPVALLTPLAELALGGSALVLVLDNGAAGRALVLAGTVVLALAFARYLSRYLARYRAGAAQDGAAGLECGCTPLSAPLTPASALPAAALALVALTGLVAALLLDRFPATAVGAPYAVPVLWGVTVAAIVMLLPATMPVPDPEGAVGHARVPAQLAR